MNTTHNMRINPEYFHLLRDGVKKVEFRLNDDKRKKVKVGDKIRFASRVDPNLVSVLTVINIIKSSSFEDLIENLDVGMLGYINKSELIMQLNCIYDPSQQNELGVLAFILLRESP